jgi:hypothetical protein
MADVQLDQSERENFPKTTGLQELLNRRTSFLSNQKKSTSEESMMNLFQMMLADQKQVLNGTMNREKTLLLSH